MSSYLTIKLSDGHARAYKDSLLNRCSDVLASTFDQVLYAETSGHLMDISAIDSAILEVHVSISHMLAHITSLRRHRNNRLPVSRLPPEVLMDIFEHSTRVTYSPEHLCSMSLSHVCAHWRQLAVSTPELWTTPDFSKPRLSAMMLERAQSAPLRIRLSISTMPVSTILQISRTIRQLTLDGGDHARTYRSNRLNLHGDFPELQRLAIANCSQGPVVDFSRLHSPRLQILSIDCSGSPNGLHHLPNSLVELDISHDFDKLRIGLDAMLELLKCTPKLKTLRLARSIKGDVPHPPYLTGTMHFLSSITLQEEPRHQVALLQRLALPKLKSCRFTQWHPETLTHGNSIRDFCTEIQRTLANAGCSHVDRMTLQQDNRYISASLEQTGPSGEDCFDISVELFQFGPVGFGLDLDALKAEQMRALGAALFADSIVTLNVLISQDEFAFVTLAEFWLALSFLPQLKHITLQMKMRDLSEHFIFRNELHGLLKICMATPGPGEPRPFPALQELELRGVEIFSDPNVRLSPLLDLERFVAAREEQGYPVTVILDSCLFTEQAMSLLELPAAIFCKNPQTRKRMSYQPPTRLKLHNPLQRKDRKKLDVSTR